MTNKEKEEEIAKLRRRLNAAEKRLAKTSQSRRDLPPGSSRARVTTANARWASAAEERQRIWDKLDELNKA